MMVDGLHRVVLTIQLLFGMQTNFPVSVIFIYEQSTCLDQIVTLNSTERNGHTDIVKGIGWDPIGRYLSTQSSDKTLKIWNTDTWKCAETITRPFVDV
jgi:protein HIRA/HIR1